MTEDNISRDHPLVVHNLSVLPRINQLRQDTEYQSGFHKRLELLKIWSQVFFTSFRTSAYT